MKIFTTLFIIVLAIAVAIFVVWTRAPDIIAKDLTKKMKVKVEIDDLGISMNDIHVTGVEIGNPRGSVLPRAFSAQSIAVAAPLSRYIDKNILIDQIVIDNVYVGLEFDSKKSKNGNWTTIMGNMHSASTGKSTRKVLISKLIVNNVQMDLAYRDEKGKITHLSPIKQMVFTNVSSEEGLPTDQITQIIMDQMLKQIFSVENLQNMIQDYLQTPPSSVEDFLKPLKGLFGK